MSRVKPRTKASSTAAKKKLEKTKTKDDTKEEKGSNRSRKNIKARSKPSARNATRSTRPQTGASRFVDTTVTKGINGLRQDFANKRRGNDQNEMRAFIDNAPMGRNRYKDVGCLDASRVILRNYPTDYIHANYVSTPMNPKRFICTQGPLDATCPDFWCMIIQENVESILMLCNIVEKGAKKCAEYFPANQGQSLTFGRFTVRNVSMTMFDFGMQTTAKVRQSKIEVLQDGMMKMTTTHYHWVDWPDRGVPIADLAVVHLLERIRARPTPIVVHCSAGIGRTGSVVLIEYALEAFLVNQSIDSMDSILEKIRSQRSASVQTDQQYLFVHQILIEYFKGREVFDDRLLRKIDAFTKEYQKVVIV